MKKVMMLLILFSITVSCDKKTKEVEKNKMLDKTIINYNCYYEGINKKDTIEFTLKSQKGIVTGALIYNYFEKDRNTGILEGKFSDDTLIADYEFMSEGMKSVRQVIFLKKDSTLIEGYGEMMEDTNGKVIFKNLKKIKFDGNNILIKKKCD